MKSLLKKHLIQNSFLKIIKHLLNNHLLKKIKLKVSLGLEIQKIKLFSKKNSILLMNFLREKFRMLKIIMIQKVKDPVQFKLRKLVDQSLKLILLDLLY